MNKNHLYWAVLPLALFGTKASAGQSPCFVPDDSTNRLTLSVRFGLNITSKFKGIGNTFSTQSIFGHPRNTPDGDRYNFDNGYVLTDSTGNVGGFTTYWGYDNASQVNRAGFPADTITFDKTTATGITSGSSSDKDKPPGIELTYDRQLGEREDWHHLRYGVEGAANWMDLSMNQNSSQTVSLTTTTTAFSFQSGDTPPAAPFQGTFSGSGYMLLEVPPTFPTTPGPTTVTPGATFTSQSDFDADLFGFRLGPYLELPVTEKISIRVSGGLAAPGLLYGNANWKESLTPSGGPTFTAKGGGDTLGVLWGGYASLNANWQFTERWGLDVGAQFQDIGKFNHNFQGRSVELDLDRSLFLEAGLSYSF